MPVLTVDMRFEDYNQLLQQRDTALDTGVYVPRNADFVTATVQVQGLPYGVLEDCDVAGCAGEYALCWRNE